MPRPTEPPPPGPSATPAAGERIAKLLARAGIASRRDVERMIADGRVARDGVAIDTPATLLTSLDGITVDGDPVAAPEPARLFLYHKPVGLLVTERDPRGRPTIYDRLPKDLPRLVPVGRLDMNTEGLLLLTTDGGLKRQLELPATGVQRTYRARAYGQVSQAQLETLIEGIEIDGMRYGSINANLERRTGANFWIELTLTEGKNREVRRVLEYMGLEISRLIRTRYGPFVLGDLPPNDIGEVRAADLHNFRRTLKGGAPAEPIAVVPQPGFRAAPTVDRRSRSGPTRPAQSNTHPGVGRGPVAKPPKERTTRGGPQSPNTPNPGTGLRRGGAGSKPASSPHPSVLRAFPSPTGRGKGPARVASGKGEGEGDRLETTPRPAKIQRKAGWAKPKPKAGPARPRKPRA